LREEKRERELCKGKWERAGSIPSLSIDLKYSTVYHYHDFNVGRKELTRESTVNR
jgi:hypothetical protein